MPEQTKVTQEKRASPYQDLRFVAASNRLPVAIEREGGEWAVRAGSGGLVTALAPVLRNRGGLWIGWPGTTEKADLTDLMDRASREAGYRLHAVYLDREEVDGYYYGFANQVLWPFFHDMVERCHFSVENWHAYQSVNRKFAEVIHSRSRSSDYVWVQDYHLMTCARELRDLDSERKVGFFLHIPFPPLETFLKLPWRGQILRALLEYDLLGFQTMRDRRNFLHCVKRLVPGIRTQGSGAVVTAQHEDREVRIGSFPISIDFHEFAQVAEQEDTKARAAELRGEFETEHVILGVDRLDYTKGIPQRLEAFRYCLERYPDLRGKVTLIQVAVPSREEVPEYQTLRAEIDRTVGEINGRFTEAGWVPIHYYYRGLNRPELIAHYLAADVALITPLKDGMNLVAKEYCASHADDDGVLILSEFAGTAAQLHRWALMVNPHDVEGVAEAIYRSCKMDEEERRDRMRRIRLSIRRNDIFRWVDSFLGAALDIHLEDVPYIEDYIPPLEAEDG